MLKLNNIFNIWACVLIDDYAPIIVNDLVDFGYKISALSSKEQLVHQNVVGLYLEHKNKTSHDVIVDIKQIIENRKLFVHMVLVMDETGGTRWFGSNIIDAKPKKNKSDKGAPLWSGRCGDEMNAAANYREMLRRELAPFRPRSDEDVIRVLTESWGHADASPPGWSEAERDVRLLWAALGLLAFGQLDHVERALSIIRDRPDVVRRRECMYYVSALRNVLPVPRELSPVNEPARVLDWLRGHSAELRWDDEAGAFVVQTRLFNR